MNKNNKQIELSGSRRSFFTKSAVLFGAGAVAAQVIGAQSTIRPVADTDIDILNYALALEHLEAAFYAEGVARYSASDYTSRAGMPVFGSKINGNLAGYIRTIRDHEMAHVATLSDTIRHLGGTPVLACSYSFDDTNVDDFLLAAMALENTGVTAYDGAIALLADPQVKQAAASIATVEARHAAYLNVLNGQIPFPFAFDTPKARSEILAIAASFISSCPGTSGPTSNPIGPAIRGLEAAVSTIESPVSFDFSRSGATDGSAVIFLFTQISGPLCAITGHRTSTPKAILLGGRGVYEFELYITDGRGSSQRARTAVTFR